MNYKVNFFPLIYILEMHSIFESSWNHEYFGSRAKKVKGFTLCLQETRSFHDSMNITKIELITYIYILYYQSSINFQFSPNLAGFPDILNLNQT